MILMRSSNLIYANGSQSWTGEVISQPWEIIPVNWCKMIENFSQRHMDEFQLNVYSTTIFFRESEHSADQHGQAEHMLEIVALRAAEDIGIRNMNSAAGDHGLSRRWLWESIFWSCAVAEMKRLGFYHSIFHFIGNVH